ncbi:MAG: hypothetical protein WAT53_04930, partial [Nitrosomonas sp.]
GEIAAGITIIKIYLHRITELRWNYGDGLLNTLNLKSDAFAPLKDRNELTSNKALQRCQERVPLICGVFYGADMMAKPGCADEYQGYFG